MELGAGSNRSRSSGSSRSCALGWNQDAAYQASPSAEADAASRVQHMREDAPPHAPLALSHVARPGGGHHAHVGHIRTKPAAGTEGQPQGGWLSRHWKWDSPKGEHPRAEFPEGDARARQPKGGTVEPLRSQPITQPSGGREGPAHPAVAGTPVAGAFVCGAGEHQLTLGPAQDQLWQWSGATMCARAEAATDLGAPPIAHSGSGARSRRHCRRQPQQLRVRRACAPRLSCGDGAHHQGIEVSTIRIVAT